MKDEGDEKDETARLIFLIPKTKKPVSATPRKQAFQFIFNL